MWKRVLTGLLLTAAIGSFLFFVSQPKPGSVAWHKKEYLAAVNRATGETWRDRIGRMYYSLRKTTPPREPWGPQQEQNLEKISSNFTALLRIGYLTERRFVLSRRSAVEVEAAIRRSADFGQNSFVQTEANTNVLRIAAPSLLMPQLEEFVRTLDGNQ